MYEYGPALAQPLTHMADLAMSMSSLELDDIPFDKLFDTLDEDTLTSLCVHHLGVRGTLALGQASQQLQERLDSRSSSLWSQMFNLEFGVGVVDGASALGVSVQASPFKYDAHHRP